MQPTFKDYLVLHVLLLFSTLGGICSKFAAQQEMFSLPFFVLYGMLLLVLLTYAVVWQQVIKNMPLTTAYLNKSVTVVWGILWGVLFFHEKITLRMGIGAAVVLAGILMVVSEDE